MRKERAAKHFQFLHFSVYVFRKPFERRSIAVVENADIESDVVFIANGVSARLILEERVEIKNTIASGWVKNFSAQIYEVVFFGNVGVQWLTRFSRHARVEPRPIRPKRTLFPSIENFFFDLLISGFKMLIPIRFI